MTDVSPHAELLAKAQGFVERCDGSVLCASKRLGVPYDFLRRFLLTAKGRHHNLARLRTALAGAGVQPPPPRSANIREIVQRGEALPLTRAILEELLVALDAAEARSTRQGAAQ